MSFLWMFFIIFAVLLVVSILLIVKFDIDSGIGITSMIFAFLFGCAVLGFLIAGIAQPISLKNEAIRQEKERQQIEYQIENLTDNKDKIKLNEWILTYNDWVNDVNTSKETYGWFSWYYNFDMTEHTIINLV